MAGEAITPRKLGTLSAADAAALFVARSAEGMTAEEEQLLAVWLELSETNRREYDSATRLWQTFINIRGDEVFAAMRAHDLAQRPKWFVSWRAAVAAGVILAVAAGATYMFAAGLSPWTADPRKKPQITVEVLPFSSLRGEVKDLEFPDGSRMTLDADSKVVGRFGPSGRNVELQKGRALFAVAPDRLRPFAVIAGGSSIVAVGTRFDVNLVGDGITVTLLEGHAVLQPKDAAAAPVTLEAGQQYIDRGGIATIRLLGVHAETVIVWRSGLLRFDDRPLSEVVQEINRYAPEQFVVADPAVAAIRHSGQFRAGDTPGTMAILSEEHQLQVVRSGNRIVLEPIRPAPSAATPP